MTISSIFTWQNSDSTEHLNKRFSSLFTKGILTGGTIESNPWVFLNTDLVPYTYTPATGIVQFTLPLDLYFSVNDYFRDGSGVYYKITSILPDEYSFTIVTISTSVKPASINTTVLTKYDGSVVSIVPVAGEYCVYVQPFTLISNDGMLCISDNSEKVTVIPDQTNIIAINAKHIQDAPSILEMVCFEASYFNEYVTKDDYVVFGAVTLTSLDTEVPQTGISYSLREIQDIRGRSALRGVIPKSFEYTYKNSSLITYTYSGGFVTYDSNVDLSNVAINDLFQDGSGVFYFVIAVDDTANTVKIVDYRTSLPPVDINIEVLTLDSGSIVKDTPQSAIDSLPLDPNFNYAGDFYVVAAGDGTQPSIWSWNGISWLNITETRQLSIVLGKHRANLFSNEIHLTDNQAIAAIGSSGTLGLTNKYVTELDSRLPSQGENDALAGTDGTPSSTNRYVTEEYPIAIPTAIPVSLSALGTIVTLFPSINGDIFVGKGGVDSANNYFSFLEGTSNRGYLNSNSLSIKVKHLWLDDLRTIPLDPSTSSDVDTFGFFTGSTLYIELENDINLLPARIIFGKKTFIKNMDRGALLLPSPNMDVVSGIVVDSLENIKGASFDTRLTEEQQNVNLKKTTDNLEGYIGSVLETNVIAGIEDFDRLATDPILGDYFEKNIGISDQIKFDNTGLIGFLYNPITGNVEYDTSVGLTASYIGNIFLDGGGNQYYITDVLDDKTISIVDAKTGFKPYSIIESVGTSRDGSIKLNNNPRDILLSGMKFNGNEEFIRVSNLTRKTDEFSAIDNQIAWGIKNEDSRFNPQICFYGDWKNNLENNGSASVNSSGSLVITGFFTDILLSVEYLSISGILNVSVDGGTPVIVSVPNGGLSSVIGPQFTKLPIATGLDSTYAHTVSISIDIGLPIYGVWLLRSDTARTAFFESGRAFQSARIIKRDTTELVTIDLPISNRGGRISYSVAEQSYNKSIGSLLNMDANNSIYGTLSVNYTDPMNPIATINLAPLGASTLIYFKENDIIQIVSASTGEVVSSIIDSISFDPNYIVLKSVPSISGAVSVRHVCSTLSNAPYPTEELAQIHYLLPQSFDMGVAGDFGDITTAADRYLLGTDGLCILSGKNISVNSGSITVGTDLRISVLTTRLDILVSSNTDFTVIVDGAPIAPVSFTLPCTGTKKLTLFSNARYQTHDVIISNTVPFDAFEFFTYAPYVSSDNYLNVVADLIQPATYIGPLTNENRKYPVGGIFRDISNISLLGTSGGWTSSIDFTKAVDLGCYSFVDLSLTPDATAEFYFLGTAFELHYITGPSHGIFKVKVDDHDLQDFSVIGDYTLDQVDAYDATYGRSYIGAKSLTYGLHKVVLYSENPAVKNALSSNYVLAPIGYYECNELGNLYMGIGKGSMFTSGVFTSTVDTRNYISLK